MSDLSTDTLRRDFVSSCSIVPWPDPSENEFARVDIDYEAPVRVWAWATTSHELSTTYTLRLPSGSILSYQVASESTKPGSIGDEAGQEVLRCLDVDDVDSAMLTLVDRLRAGDLLLEMELAMIARGLRTRDNDMRALALETLAAARARESEGLVAALILELLDSDSEQLRFASIAAASDLSELTQFVVAGPISRLASRDESADVRAAARAFYAYVENAR